MEEEEEEEEIDEDGLTTIEDEPIAAAVDAVAHIRAQHKLTHTESDNNHQLD